MAHYPRVHHHLPNTNPILTWAMLVMKKGSQALKKSPSRTPRVRLAFRALLPCLCARRRSLFTDGWRRQRTAVSVRRADTHSSATAETSGLGFGNVRKHFKRKFIFLMLWTLVFFSYPNTLSVWVKPRSLCAQTSNRLWRKFKPPPKLIMNQDRNSLMVPGRSVLQGRSLSQRTWATQIGSL